MKVMGPCTESWSVATFTGNWPEDPPYFECCWTSKKILKEKSADCWDDCLMGPSCGPGMHTHKEQVIIAFIDAYHLTSDRQHFDSLWSFDYNQFSLLFCLCCIDTLNFESVFCDGSKWRVYGRIHTVGYKSLVTGHKCCL